MRFQTLRDLKKLTENQLKKLPSSALNRCFECDGTDFEYGQEIKIMYEYEMCMCGHFGGVSPKEQHLPRFQKGHGKCNHCNCEQFTWVGFCDEDGNITS